MLAEPVLDAPLPASLVIGRGQALIVRGSYEVVDPATRLAIMVDGVPQELFVDRDGRRVRFWAVLALPDADAGETSVVLRVTSPGGVRRWHDLATIELLSAVPRVADIAAVERPGGRGPCVAVCLATFAPDLELLRVQLDSLRAQTHSRWIAIVSDDGSPPECFDAIARLVAGDRRFRLLDRGEHRGFHGNFERALGAVPPWVDEVALCDQDDVWHPEKLRALSVARRDSHARLICCDARIVRRDGTVHSNTYWSGRRRGGCDLQTVLSANWVSGAMSQFDAALLSLALPFPSGPEGLLFHDQWLACAAAASGTIAYHPRALVDYVQHGGNAYSHACGVAPELRRLDLARGLRILRDARRGGARCGVACHQLRGAWIDALVRARALATTLRLRGAADARSEPLASAAADMLKSVAARHARRAVVSRLRGGPAQADAALAFGAAAVAIDRRDQP